MADGRPETHAFARVQIPRLQKIASQSVGKSRISCERYADLGKGLHRFPTRCEVVPDIMGHSEFPGKSSIRVKENETGTGNRWRGVSGFAFVRASA